MIKRLLLLAGMGAIGLAVAGCFPFSSDQQPAAPQQQGPVVVPVINNPPSDNSGWFVLVTFVIVGLAVGIGLVLRAWLKERDAARDARAVTNRVLDALPDDLHREVTYVLGYQPAYHQRGPGGVEIGQDRRLAITRGQR